MACSHVYRRGGLFWWRRRIRLRNGEVGTVAISLGIREPSMAWRVGRRVTVQSDNLMTDASIQSRRQFVDSLTQFVQLQQLDEAVRVQRDLKSIADSPDSRYILEQRIRENRIYAALNAIAAEFGPDCVHSDQIDASLKQAGFTDFERDKVRHRLEKPALAREVFKPGSSVAGVPPQQVIESILTSKGITSSDASIRKFLETLARHRRDLLQQSAAMYADAADNIPAPSPRFYAKLDASPQHRRHQHARPAMGNRRRLRRWRNSHLRR